MITLRRILFAGAAFLCAAATLANEVEIIGLKHRTVEEVLPVLRPLVDPGGVVSGMQGQLVLRTGPRNMAQLKQVLAAIDTPRKRLLITVRQDREASGARDGGGITGSIGNERARAGHGTAPGGVQARVYSSRSASDEHVAQSIQTLDGMPAFIAMGQSVPVRQQTTTVTPRGYVISESTGYRGYTTGFSVVPRVTGDRVTLEVSPRRDTPAEFPNAPGASGGANLQGAVTTVSGRLGEWLELGGMREDVAQSDRRILSSASAAREDQRRLWVKVDEVP